MRRSLPLLLGLLGVVASAGLPYSGEAAILIQNGQRIGFMGDSITEQGAAPSGYVSLVIMGLKAEGVDAAAIPAGVAGNTSGNMRGRVGPQILEKGADWMTLSCGVNDVGLQAKGHGVDLETFRKNVTAIAEQALARKVRVVILTTSPLGEDLEGDRNKQIAPYNDFLRAYAKEKGLVLADVNAAFQAVLRSPMPSDYSGKPDQRLLADGTHPNQDGQTLMAQTVLLALGVPPADLPKIEKEWMENPRGKGVRIAQGTMALISQRQYRALEKLASETHQTAIGIVQDLWAKELKKYTEQSGTPADPSKATEAVQSKIGAQIDDFLKTRAVAQ